MVDRGIQVENAYKKSNMFLRTIRRMWFRYKFPFEPIWFNKNLHQLDCNTIIVWDPVMTVDFVRWLRKIHPNKRIIFWYWNPVRRSVNPKLLTDDICEKWSYSLRDCERFNLKYNTTFYFKELRAPKAKPIWDILFVGKDKGRLAELVELKNQFKALNLKTNFHITPTKRYMARSNSIYKEHISYDEVLIEIGRSKAILDLLGDPSDGLSLRAMESIFHKKKLITNSRLIIKYDFYRPQNIFVLGMDNLNYLPKFLNLPYEEIDERIIEKYDFEQWLSRFYNF